MKIIPKINDYLLFNRNKVETYKNLFKLNKIKQNLIDLLKNLLNFQLKINYQKANIKK